MKRVLEGGPWTFEKNPLLMARMEDGVLPTQIPLINMDISKKYPCGILFKEDRQTVGDFIVVF